MKERNILLTIEYDGTHFSGWQRQPEKRTVQGELERVLSQLCRVPIKISGTSRTDAGVHALGQRASFSGCFGIPTERLAEAANNMLAESRLIGTGDVRIREAVEVPMDFHARFSAKGKKYLYRFHCGNKPDVFLRNYRCQLSEMLDIAAMNAAAEHIAGRHDFRCFQAAGGEEKKTTVRTIYGIRVYEENALLAACGINMKNSGECSALCRKRTAPAEQREEESREIVLAVCGDGFLYNMVRIIAGTLAEVGLGKRAPEELAEIVAGRDRRRAGYTAPPQGLYLKEVYYDETALQQSF